MINISKLKLTKLQQEIFQLVCINAGKTINQRQIAKILKVSQPAVKKALPHLENEEIIIMLQDKESKRWSIELNRDNHKVMQLKRVENLRQIYASAVTDSLENEFAGATIILFGSYSMGEDTINSDIDIAVIGRKEKSINLRKYEELLKRKIIINQYDSFKNIHKHLRENIFNGIVLTGSVEA